MNIERSSEFRPDKGRPQIESIGNRSRGRLRLPNESSGLSSKVEYCSPDQVIPHPEGAAETVGLGELVGAIDPLTREGVRRTAEDLLETLKQLAEGTGGADIDESARAFVKALHPFTACFEEKRLRTEVDKDSVRWLKQQDGELGQEEVLAAQIAELDPATDRRPGQIAAWVTLACVVVALASGGALTPVMVAEKFSLDAILKVGATIGVGTGLGFASGNAADRLVIAKQERRHLVARGRLEPLARKVAWIVVAYQPEEDLGKKENGGKSIGGLGR